MMKEYAFNVSNFIPDAEQTRVRGMLLRVFLRAAVKMLIDNCMAPPDYHRLDRSATTMVVAAAGMLFCVVTLRDTLRLVQSTLGIPSAIIHRRIWIARKKVLCYLSFSYL